MASQSWSRPSRGQRPLMHGSTYVSVTSVVGHQRRLTDAHLFGPVYIRDLPSIRINWYSGSCRVEVWRGGWRSNASVAAPFVWRCLTGSAVAPFPHPQRAQPDRSDVLTIPLSPIDGTTGNGSFFNPAPPSGVYAGARVPQTPQPAIDMPGQVVAL
jgi:hypothetical protein